MTYSSLNNHSNFSIGASTIRVKELFENAKKLGQPAIAITDYNTLAGMWDAYKASKKTNVKLIPGCTFNFVENLDEEVNRFKYVVLLAKNATGYKNLLRLSKAGFDNFIVAWKRALPRVDYKLLSEHSEGIICLAGGPNGMISNNLMAGDVDGAIDEMNSLKDIFKDDFYLELQPHNMQRRVSNYSVAVNQQKINVGLRMLSIKYNIPAVVTTNVHYDKREDSEDHDVLLCIHSGQPKYSGQRLYFDKSQFFFKSEDEVRTHFERHERIWGKDFINSLFANTQKIVDACGDASYVDPAVSTGEKSQLPDFPIEEEPDYKDFLEWKSKYEHKPLRQDALFYRYRSFKGLDERIARGHIPQEDKEECIAQLYEEFDVLEYRGFSSYMLLTADFLNWCRENHISVGPGRGSVGGSLSAYCNNIHQAYPKRYGLIFARFLNKYKEAFPDIDNDIAPSRRHLLKDYLKKKYGEDMVAHVSNINTVTPKVYARDISRVFEFGDMGRSEAAEIGNNIADSIPADVKTAEKALTEAPLFAEYAKVYPQLKRFAHVLGGQPRAWSTHAGGLVIGKVPLADIVPLRRDTQGNIVLEYEKERAEENGLVKIDALGLSTLDIIQLTNDLIRENGKTPPPNDFDYEQYDEKTYGLISKGDTFGVFQLGGTAVPVCKAVKPRSVADIALISALVRPAAKEIINDLIEVRNGNKPMELAHESLERAFKDTYGYGLYEESLLYLAQDVAGWDLHDADKLRKLTKEKGKNPEKVKKWREEFIAGGINNKGFMEDFVTSVWDETIAGFGGYGFNKSHATLYSMISFHTAYLKAHFPLEFLLANLMHEVNSNARDAKENIIKIKSEIRALGVRIVPPDINSSGDTYKIIDDKTLMTGLDALKYMGKDAIPELVKKRPFSSFSDLIERTESDKVRSPTIQALAACGGLDCFEIDRKLMFYYASDYRAKLRAHMNKLYRKWKTGEPSPEDVAAHIKLFKYPFPQEVPWNVREKFALEEYYMGEGISGTVFERYNGFLKNGVVRFTDLPKIKPYRKASDDEKKDRYANRHDLNEMGIRNLKGIISHVFSFTVKKEDSKIFGQEMARITLLDPWDNDITVICFPDPWVDAKERVKLLTNDIGVLEPGLAISITGQFQWESSHSYSIILGDIISLKEKPPLPEDLKSRKVRMPRAKKADLKKEDIVKMSTDEFVDVLEDIMTESGISSIIDDDDDEYNSCFNGV